MLVDSFVKLYKILSKTEDNGLKALLSETLMYRIDLLNTLEPTLIPNSKDTTDTIQCLEHTLNKAFSVLKRDQEFSYEGFEDFDTLDKISASYAVSCSFDARVSHHSSSCDYFILFELLRCLEKQNRKANVSPELINEAIEDIVHFDENFAMPTIRLAISNLKTSIQKDAIILADLILLFFNGIEHLRETIKSSNDVSSAANIAENGNSIEEKIRNIIAYKVINLFKKENGPFYLKYAVAKLSDIKYHLRDNLRKLNLKNRNHTLTMEKIVIGKSSMAYGYHNKKMINRCPLDELMKKDPQEFIFHLKNSSWFKGENANKMPFFSKLTSFEGPMYKVFTKNELLLIKKWAISERRKDNDLEDIIINSFPVMDILPHSHEYDDEKDIRKFFHQLMTCDDHYYLDWKCEKFVNGWLYKTRKKINKIPFKNYEETLLDEWFLERAKMSIEDYSQGRMVFNKSRKDVISEALHLAPMVLLDGAWINHYSHHNLINDDIGKILFEIYADEIGNGYIEKNHPLIYRNLISEMGIELPDIASAAFSESEHFDDDDFQVPVFWLSISRFPKRFLPETLGLNLAMELSGVGGAYNQARDELKQYGFNTLFVDLHNSIDNAASGHSADALNAIKIYMNKHANKSNPKLTRLLWERVWTGYLSLSPPKKTLSFFLISNNYDI